MSVDIVASLITAGVVGTILTAMISLVRYALGAAERRANDWREIARTREAANAVMSTQVEKLIVSVEQLAHSQREVMSLVQTMAAADRRDAA